jgi:hypothetical protein
LRVHAPGAIAQVNQSAASLSFTVDGWPERPYFVLVNGLRGKPQVHINGQAAALSEPHQFIEAKGRLILQVSGKARIEVKLN